MMVAVATIVASATSALADIIQIAAPTITRSTFSAPGPTSYVGYGFNYMQITGNESGSTGRSNISNLVINGTSFSGSLTPNGTFLERFYREQNGLTENLTLTGDLTFTTTGTSQERPSWNVTLGNSAAALPEPGTIMLALSGLAPMGVLVRFKRRLLRTVEKPVGQ